MSLSRFAAKLDAGFPRVVLLMRGDNPMTTTMQPNAEKQHIESVPGRCGGKPCIVGHRIRVQDVVLWTEQGMSPDAIAAAYPQITLADVHAALTYYFDNTEAINQDIREDDELVSRLKEANGPNLLGTVK